jgi:predicted enzyme related to lactoylglutathione lyase
MGAALSLVVIRASDLERSQRFYEALGLSFTRERHGSGPEHLAAEMASVVFEVYPRGNGPVTHGVRLGFRVSSVAAALAAAQQLGAEVVSPPADSPWGLRAVLADPDGHRVEINQLADHL